MFMLIFKLFVVTFWGVQFLLQIDMNFQNKNKNVKMITCNFHIIMFQSIANQILLKEILLLFN
jgi:hypothetical protein